MRIFWLPLALSLGGTAALAEEYPAPIQALQERGVEVLAKFPAPADMTGFVVTLGADPEVVYLTPDGKHAIVGVMLDAQGNNLSAAQLNRHTPEPDYADAWKQAEQATWVAEGAEDPKSIVYAFADPYCPYCNALWQATQPYQKAGLQVRWIPVAYLHPDSAATAAAILQAEDPAAALAEHESRFDEGGIGPLLEPDPKIIEAVEENTRLMQRVGVRGTPAVLYRDDSGKVHMVQGMPRLSQLPEIFRLPEQEIAAPDLQRFR